MIGAGGSGLPAGLKALEDGASVIMVEANYDCGGHAAVSEGQLHSGGYTVSQKEWDVTDSSDRYYYDHTRGFLDSRYNDREVTRSVANSIAEAYDFVLKKGIVVQDIEPMIRAYYRDGGYDADGVARMTYVDATEWENDITGRKNNGIGVTRPLEKSLRDAGVPFLMNYHMDTIVREAGEGGKVQGIVAHYSPMILPGETEPLKGFFSEGNIDSTKEEVTVKANKAVIICTGGSIGNVYFRTMFDPRLGPEFDGLAGMPFSDQDASGEIAAGEKIEVEELSTGKNDPNGTAGAENYIGTSDNGMGGAIKVEVIVFNGQIANIKVVEQNETVGIGDVALEKLVAQAKEKKSAEVDIVTGASITSAAFIEALTNALDKIK